MRIRPVVGFVFAMIAGRVGLGQTDVPNASAVAPARVARLAEARTIRQRLGLTPAYDNLPRVDAVRIAVLDYGFEGLGPGRDYLPAGAEIVEHYDPEFVKRNGLGDPDLRKGFEPGNRHGRDMAQIIWAMTGSRPSGPQFLLLNANGPTMLRRAVRYAVERQVDVILFSGSFEGGGNGDGRGPIDHVVDEAVGRGILWINAAGNQGGHVFAAPVRPLNDGYLKLRDGADIASIRFRNRVDENTVTVTLTWNDYREEEDAGTDKDLDLFVEDPSGRVVGSGEKRQTSGDREATDAESRNPRERVVLANLPALPVVSDRESAYRIRVRAKSGRFEDTDRIRILVTAAPRVVRPAGRDLARGGGHAARRLEPFGDLPASRPLRGPDRGRRQPVLVGRPDPGPPCQAGRGGGGLAGGLHRRPDHLGLVECRRPGGGRGRVAQGGRADIQPPTPAEARPPGPAPLPGRPHQSRASSLADPEPGPARRSWSARVVDHLLPIRRTGLRSRLLSYI